MVLSFGDPMIFLQRPISLCILLASAALVVLIVVPQLRTRRDEAFQE
jgi:putative tricarboxylic transport membrane protein